MSEGVNPYTKKFRFRLSPILIISLTIFVDITGYAMIIPLLPFYALSFQVGPTAIGFLIASFSIMQFIFAPLLGRISDKVGRKPVLLISLLTSAFSFILFALANSFFILIVSRIISGMATETAVAQAYIADVTTEKDRTKVMGRMGAAFSAGFIIGPAIGGFLSIYGFSAPGFAAFTLALVNFIFVLLLLPESVRRQDTVRNESVNPSFLSKLRKAISRPLIGPVLLIFFIMIFAFSALPVIAPLLAKSFFNFGSIEISYVFVYMGIIHVIVQGFLIGRLAGKFGDKGLVALGPLFMTLGVFAMPLIPNIVIFLVTITVISIGNGLIRTAIPSFISKKTPPSEQGGMMGMTLSVENMALIPGPLIAGMVLEIAGLAAPFFLSAALLIGAFVLGCRVFHICINSAKE
jgi:multidrug resistance protein